MSKKKRPAPKRSAKCRLSLCMIARDEEEFIGRCLASAGPVADEIIVVDTGSTDATVEIAKQYGARVIDFAWNDDFSAARNVGLEQARGQWILHLDADEELVAEDLPQLRRLLDDDRYEAYFVSVVNLMGPSEAAALENAVPRLRLFRHHPEHRFIGAVHEVVAIRGGHKAAMSSVRVRHYGYLDSVAKSRRKQARNRRLVDVAYDPGSVAGRRLRANELMAAGQYEEALAIYTADYPELTDDMAAAAVALNVANCLRSVGKLDQALTWLDSALARFPDYTDLEYLRAVTLLDLTRHEEALSSLAVCLALGDAPPVYNHRMGIGSWMAWQAIGVAFYGMECSDVAGAAFRRALGANRADAFSARRLGELLLASAYPWEAVRRELLELVDSDSADIKDAMAHLAQVAAGTERGRTERNR